MYGGRYGLTRYSLRVGEWTVEVGGTFSDVLGGLVGGTLPVSVGAVFSEELGGSVRGALAVDVALAAEDRLMFQGQLRADVEVRVRFSDTLGTAARAGKNLPAALEGSAALLGHVWASKDMPIRESFADALAGTAAGSKDILGDLLAAAVLTTSAEAGVQSRDRAVFQLTIPPGGELRIDSGLYTVLLNGENALHAQEGDWVELSRSLVRLTVECAQGGGLAGQIVYQERYL